MSENKKESRGECEGFDQLLQSSSESVAQASSSLVGIGGMCSHLGTGSEVAFPPGPCFDATRFLTNLLGSVPVGKMPTFSAWRRVQGMLESVGPG